MNNEQRSYFNVMYSGTIQVIMKNCQNRCLTRKWKVIEDLCREGPYQTAYLSHAPCMTTVQEEYQKCSKRYRKKTGWKKNLSSLLSYQEKLHKIQTSDSISSETTDNDVGILCCSFQVSNMHANTMYSWELVPNVFNIPGIFGLQHECCKLDLWPGHRSLHKTVLGSDGKSSQPGNNALLMVKRRMSN